MYISKKSWDRQKSSGFDFDSIGWELIEIRPFIWSLKCARTRSTTEWPLDIAWRGFDIFVMKHRSSSHCWPSLKRIGWNFVAWDFFENDHFPPKVVLGLLQDGFGPPTVEMGHRCTVRSYRWREHDCQLIFGLLLTLINDPWGVDESKSANFHEIDPRWWNSDFEGPNGFKTGQYWYQSKALD